jgi:DNA-binding CsgD family transcriptional regulator
MDGTPKLTYHDWPLAFELGRALDDASTFSELHESTEKCLAELCRANHVALCMARPDSPTELEFKTRTMQPLLRDLPRWSSKDFVSCSVIECPNRALTDREMLRGTALERTETWQRSREQGLNLNRVLAMLILPVGPGVPGGVTLYREDPRPFSKKNQQTLDWFMPRFRRAFQSINRFAESATRQQILESLAGQDSAALVFTSQRKEFLRTPSATAMLQRWFSRFELDRSGIPRQWMEQLAELVRTDGNVGPALYSWRREGTCRDLEVTFLPLTHVAGPRLWELKMKETVLLPERWRVLLTPAQVGVADGILRGLQDKEIAIELNVQSDTVKQHAQAIYEKVGADGRSDFIYRALRP